MKARKLSVLLFGAALLLSSSVFAKEKTKATLELSDPVTVEGRTLHPGKYTVEWTGSGPNVQVTISQGKNAVATIPAQLAQQASPTRNDEYGTFTTADGSKTLTAIYIGGNRSYLEFQQSEARQQSSTNRSK